MPWKDDYSPTSYSIQYQYARTNIDTLLGKIAGIRGKYKRQAVTTFQSDVRNLKSAIGGALDLWGRILKFPRYIPLNTGAGTTYKKFSFYQSYFKELQFGRIDESDFLRLPDVEYRMILLLILQGRNTPMLISHLNGLAQDTFSQVGLNCDVFDNWESNSISYVVDDIPPLWLSWVIQEYDILPRPAGIKADFLVDKVLPIGFYRPPPAPAESNQEISNFYYSKFWRPTI